MITYKTPEKNKDCYRSNLEKIRNKVGQGKNDNKKIPNPVDTYKGRTPLINDTLTLVFTDAF